MINDKFDMLTFCNVLDIPFVPKTPDITYQPVFRIQPTCFIEKLSIDLESLMDNVHSRSLGVRRSFSMEGLAP